MSASPRLTFTREGETLKSQTLDREISIGRAEGNVIRLEDRAVSRKHAVVRKTEEGVHIEKQSDFAPIRLNGIECTRALLKEGDVVEIGPFRMRLETPAAREVSKPAAAPAAVAETARDPEATVAIAEIASVPDAVPTEAVAPFSIGEFGGEGALPDLARPIDADSAGADAGSRDPGTNIFPADGGEGAEILPLEIDLGPGAPLETAMPDEIPAGPVDENAATRILDTGVQARLEIAEGSANVATLPLAKGEVVLGRGKECDVVLNDKKSSRKNTVIAREGNRYRVKDLGSSNGTYLNGAAVRDAELSDGDAIRIGDVEIRFVADSADYEKRKASFVPAESETPDESPGSLAPEDLSAFAPAIAGTPIGYVEPFGAPAETPASRKGIGGAYDKYFRNFGSLKPLQKLLVVLSVGLFLSWYFEDELGLTEPPKPAPKTVAAARKSPDGKPAVATDYDGLTPEKRGQIDEAIRKATDFLRLQDFDKAIYEVQQRVYPILPNYAQAKEIERYAQEGKRRKDAIEEEAKRKEEAARLKARIAELENATRDLMAHKRYEQARESFGEILAIDPENATVSEWRKEIDAWAEERDRLEKEKQVQEEINKRAWDTYNEGFALHKAGKYREAIELYRKVTEIGADDAVLARKAATMTKACQDSIRELRDPHLAKAKELEGGGDLGAAFKEYQRATEIDPPHPEGWAGMDRIRDVLNERAKILYTEAVIAESYSDFKTAHAKFGEILKMAPEGSLYFQRAQRKLQSYVNFHSEEAP